MRVSSDIGQRPMISHIAVRWGYWTSRQLDGLLGERQRERSTERLGDYALRRGMLTEAQRMPLVGRQRLLQRPIGEYFVESGMLSREAVARLAQQN